MIYVQRVHTSFKELVEELAILVKVEVIMAGGNVNFTILTLEA